MKQRRAQYSIRYDVVLKNRLNGETVRGNLVNEKDIDGKHYWVLNVPSRGAAQLSYAKESWTMTKGK